MKQAASEDERRADTAVDESHKTNKIIKVTDF